MFSGFVFGDDPVKASQSYLASSNLRQKIKRSYTDAFTAEVDNNNKNSENGIDNIHKEIGRATKRRREEEERQDGEKSTRKAVETPNSGPRPRTNPLFSNVTKPTIDQTDFFSEKMMVTEEWGVESDGEAYDIVGDGDFFSKVYRRALFFLFKEHGATSFPSEEHLAHLIRQFCFSKVKVEDKTILALLVSSEVLEIVTRVEDVAPLVALKRNVRALKRLDLHNFSMKCLNGCNVSEEDIWILGEAMVKAGNWCLDNLQDSSPAAAALPFDSDTDQLQLLYANSNQDSKSFIDVDDILFEFDRLGVLTKGMDPYLITKELIAQGFISPIVHKDDRILELSGEPILCDGDSEIFCDDEEWGERIAIPLNWQGSQAGSMNSVIGF